MLNVHHTQFLSSNDGTYFWLQIKARQCRLVTNVHNSGTS